MNEQLRALLARIGLDGDGWQVVDVAHNRWLTPGIWQLERGNERVIVKWLSKNRLGGSTAYENHWAANSADPTRWNYWAREALAYKSGLADVFAPAGMTGPRCIGIGVDVARDDAVIALAFEAGTPGDQWTIVQYADAAHALGRAQAPYLCGEPLPAQPWLSDRFLRTYSAEKPVDWSLLDDDAAWMQPLVRDCFPAELRAAVGALHANADRLYDIAERLPRTLCHLDFWSKNLIRRHDGSHVLLDWAFVGLGAPGEDIGNLIPDACFDHFITSDRLPELDTAVFDAYVSGLAEGGWNGDERIVRLGMWASAVKYDWLTPHMLASASATKQMRYGGTEEIDATERFRERGVALLFNARRALAALELATDLAL
jgi:Phosphotransferase enzyme family